MDVKWIKLSANVFDNRKIKILESMPEGDAMIIIWFKLLTLAGETNDRGMIYFTEEIPYTDQLLATQFNRPLSIVQLALSTFEKFGMIDIIDDIIRVSNWEKYQNTDKLDKVREQTRKRVADHRRKRLDAVDNPEDKDVSEDVTECNANDVTQCNVTESVTQALLVTQCNATDKEEEIDKDIKEKSTLKGTKREKSAVRFVPPTVEEVEAYCMGRKNKVDPERFVDFYASKGWKVGNQKMKDWKAAVRTWEKREQQEYKFGNKQSYSNQRQYDYDQLERKLIGVSGGGG